MKRLGGIDRAIAIQDKGILLAIHLYGEQVLSWIKEIRGKGSFAEVKKMDFSLDPRSSEVLQKAMLVSYLEGAWRVKKEIAYQLESGKLASFADYTGDFDLSGTYDEAIEWFRAKGILTSSQFSQLDSKIKSISFSVAGLEEEELLEAINQSITDAMSEGLNFKQWAKGVDETFNKFGVTPLSPNHLETVYRTNLMSVFNIAKHESMIADENTEAIMYCAILDDRVRESHAAMDGFIAAKDDPIWDTWYPPNDYNCRCTTIPISGEYLQRHNLELADSLPDGVTDDGVGEDFRESAFTLEEFAAVVKDRLAA